VNVSQPITIYSMYRTCSMYIVANGMPVFESDGRRVLVKLCVSMGFEFGDGGHSCKF
jgi:hypothetical protein